MKDTGKYRKLWIGLRVLFSAGLIIFCVGVWPGYLVHTYKMDTMFTSQVFLTPWLSTGDVVQQYFCPQDSRLSKIKIALAFDESAVTEEYLLFEIQDKNGQPLYNSKIFFDQIESDHYFDVDVGGKKLKTHEVYTWTLTLPNGRGTEYAVLCQVPTDTIKVAVENQTLFINDEEMPSIALNLYEYYAHYDKSVIIGGFWIGALLVWLILMEVTDRAEQFCEGKKA